MTKPRVEGFCDPEFSKLEEIFVKSVESGFDDGAGFALEVEGKEVLNLWGGYTDKEHKTVWQENTLVNVFSVTKAMTSTCALQLIESGKLDTEALVSDYWPEYSCAGKEQTKVIDFLTHRAGMFGFQTPLPQDSWEDWNMIVDRLAKQEPIREPGTTQGYHAMTFGYLVGELVRRIDGRSLGNYFKEEIADEFDIDFIIGLDNADIERCADMLMLSGRPNPLILILLSLPNWLLPQQIKNFKETLRSKEFSKAFVEIMESEGSDFRTSDYPNSDPWRKAEIPAANGHGTATGIAKFFGILANDGQRDGKKLLSPEIIEQATTIRTSGPDLVLFQAPYKFGLGYMIDAPFSPIGMQEGMFGHTGIAGSAGFADLNNKVGFGFTNNRQHSLGKLYRTSNNLAKKLYEIL